MMENDAAPDPQKPNDLFIKLAAELKLVEDHPRMLVLIAHGFTELVVNALIDHHCKNAKKITDDSLSFPHSAKLLILNEPGVLTDHHYKLLDWFRKLRNDSHTSRSSR